jgi:hypothetical protein
MNIVLSKKWLNKYIRLSRRFYNSKNETNVDLLKARRAIENNCIAKYDKLTWVQKDTTIELISELSRASTTFKLTYETIYAALEAVGYTIEEDDESAV